MDLKQCTWRMGQGIRHTAQAIGMTGIVHRPAMTRAQAQAVRDNFYAGAKPTLEAERAHLVAMQQANSIGAALSGFLSAVSAGLVPALVEIIDTLDAPVATFSLVGVLMLICLAETAHAYDDAVDIKRAIAVLYGNRPHAHPPTAAVTVAS